MNVPTLSLAIITNTSEHLAKTLGSVATVVDEIVIVDNGTDKKVEKIAEKFKAKFIKVNPKDNPELYCEYPEGNFNPNFTRLRRLSFNACTKDWILWLDNDDEFINAGLITENLIKADSSNLNMLNLQYKYEIDEHGNVLEVHNKERFLKRGFWQWEYDDEWGVHENLYPINEKNNKGALVFDMVVEHHKEFKNRSRSNLRNYNILMWMLKKEKFQRDPRVWYLLARELISLRNYEKAVELFNRYLGMEYAPHDGLDACIQCCNILEGMGDFTGALAYAMRGIGIRPDHPKAYLYAARYLNYQGKPDEAIDFVKQSEQRSINPIDQTIQQPMDLAWLTLTGYINAYKKKKDFEKVLEYIGPNIDRFPTTLREQLEEDQKEANKEITMGKMLDAIQLLINNKTGEIKSDGKVPTIKDYVQIFNLFDQSLKIAPLYMNLRKQTQDFRVHDDNEITIVHVNNFEHWDPKTIIENGGGGSETACVELSTRFQKAGYKVTVYAEPPKDNTKFKGVTWRKYENINFADKFNIFICLRSPTLFTEYDIEANKKYLWLQDIMYPEQFTPDLYEQLDKIIVLSKYHRETAINVPEGKFYYTTNGINLKLIKEIERENVKRIKNKCVYISSADRGLEPLVKMWPKVKKAIPGADLSDAYGWKSWNAFRHDKNAELFKQKIIRDMKKAGIHDLGRIGKKDLYRLLLSASYHTYPYIGPAETSCIAVMESQALGAIPITTGNDALEETQQYGIKVPIHSYENVLIKTMQAGLHDNEKYRKKMMNWARKTYNWDRVAERWVEDLFRK